MWHLGQVREAISQLRIILPNGKDGMSSLQAYTSFTSKCDMCTIGLQVMPGIRECTMPRDSTGPSCKRKGFGRFTSQADPKDRRKGSFSSHIFGIDI